MEDLRKQQVASNEEVEDRDYTIDERTREVGHGKKECEAYVQAAKNLNAQVQEAANILGKVCVYGTLVSGETSVNPPEHAAIRAMLTQIERANRAEAKLSALHVFTEDDWSRMTGSNIDTVHLTNEDDVRGKLKEQLKRYFTYVDLQHEDA